MALLVDFAYPVQSLACIFLAWKAFLFAIAIGSGVSPAYDTSSTLLSTGRASYHESAFDLATRLTRWDAIYYVQASRRGYLFEQEWAFASGLPTVISFLTNGTSPLYMKMVPVLTICNQFSRVSASSKMTHLSLS